MANPKPLLNVPSKLADVWFYLAEGVYFECNVVHFEM